MTRMRWVRVMKRRTLLSMIGLAAIATALGAPRAMSAAGTPLANGMLLFDPRYDDFASFVVSYQRDQTD